MAFAEPLEAERVPYPASPVANEEISVEIPETFTLWDTIEVLKQSLLLSTSDVNMVMYVFRHLSTGIR